MHIPSSGSELADEVKKNATSTGYFVYRASSPHHEHKTIQVSKCLCQDTPAPPLHHACPERALSADGSSNCIWVLDVTCEVPEEDALADAVFTGAAVSHKTSAGHVVSTEPWKPDGSCRFTCSYKHVRFYQIDIKRVKNIFLLPLIQQLFFKEPQHKCLRPGLNLPGMDTSVCPLMMLEVDDSPSWILGQSGAVQMTSNNLCKFPEIGIPEANKCTSGLNMNALRYGAK